MPQVSTEPRIEPLWLPVGRGHAQSLSLDCVLVIVALTDKGTEPSLNSRHKTPKSSAACANAITNKALLWFH